MRCTRNKFAPKLNVFLFTRMSFALLHTNFSSNLGIRKLAVPEEAWFQFQRSNYQKKKNKDGDSPTIRAT